MHSNQFMFIDDVADIFLNRYHFRYVPVACAPWNRWKHCFLFNPRKHPATSTARHCLQFTFSCPNSPSENALTGYLKVILLTTKPDYKQQTVNLHFRCLVRKITLVPHNEDLTRSRCHRKYVACLPEPKKISSRILVESKVNYVTLAGQFGLKSHFASIQSAFLLGQAFLLSGVYENSNKKLWKFFKCSYKYDDVLKMLPKESV